MLYTPTNVGLADSSVADIIETVIAIGTPMTTALGIAGDALEALDIFLTTYPEPFAAAAQLIIDEIDNVREDLFESGIKIKVIDPTRYGRNPRTRVKQTLLGQLIVDEAQTPSDLANWTDKQILTIQNSKLVPSLSFDQANRILISTITNPGINAPTFSGPVEALNIVFASPSPSQLLPSLNAFSAIFKFPEMERIKRKVGAILAKQGVYLRWKTNGDEIGFRIYKGVTQIALLDPRRKQYHDNTAPASQSKSDYTVKSMVVSGGETLLNDIEFTFSQILDEDLRTNKDDWVSVTPVQLIPGSTEANNELKQAIYDMGVYAKAAEGGLSAASVAIQNKINQINQFTSKYQNLLDIIAAGADSGCFVGSYSGSTGVDDLVADMANSSGVPEGLNYCVLTSFVGGTASLDGLKTLLGL
ncbi:hypothetical protein KAR91_88575 [Candidatus Pacearchaeota archaeon]|nr:hypothetical protein [Candidatus Pacearchaeota archaeon]